MQIPQPRLPQPSEQELQCLKQGIPRRDYPSARLSKALPGNSGASKFKNSLSG